MHLKIFTSELCKFVCVSNIANRFIFRVINLFWSRWLKEGDAYTRYFHSSIKARGSRNRFSTLRVGNLWIHKVSNIRVEVTRFFRVQFVEDDWDRPHLNGITFPVLSPLEASSLSPPFSLEEVDRVVADCEGNKSPETDGFNFSFIKAFWDLLCPYMDIFFKELYINAKLPISFYSYFVALIPKVRSPLSLRDYRLVSLLGCLYKILAKVLSARLNTVMGSLISPVQSAFIKGRNFVDGVLVVNEAVDFE